MAKILIVEDERSLADVMCDSLKAHDYLVDHVGNGSDALIELKINQYDLIILDWTLPGTDGLTVLKQFRDGGGCTPIIMLTGKRELDDKEAGLNAGADDYLTKPFHMRELVARVNAMLRRVSRDQPVGQLTARGVSIDTTSRRVLLDGSEVSLLPREFALLEFLMRHPSQVFSAEAIIQRVWPTDSEASPSAVRIYVTRLRKKIDKDPERSLITTVHGVGYRLDP